MKLQLFATIAVAASGVMALGINCKGNVHCHGRETAPEKLQHIIEALNASIAAGNADLRFPQGPQLACSGIFCAFYQKYRHGGTVRQAYDLLSHLKETLDCDKCGSVPLLPGDDVNTGEITVNFVTFQCCKGLSCFCLPEDMHRDPKKTTSTRSAGTPKTSSAEQATSIDDPEVPDS